MDQTMARRSRAWSRARRSSLVTLMSLSLLGGVAQATPAQAEAPQPVIGQPAKGKDGCAKIEKSLPTLADWPKVDSRLTGKAGDEQRIAEILKGMTLEEKVGQMTQPEIASIPPDEVRQYAIGSVLNGGGSWPGGKKYATQQDW